MMNEDLKMLFDAPNIVCPKCGAKIFKEVYVLKKISPIISPTGKEETVPIPFYACAQCGTIPDEIAKSKNYKAVMGDDSQEDENPAEPVQTSSGIILP